jgi:hypothetical protein
MIVFGPGRVYLRKKSMPETDKDALAQIAQYVLYPAIIAIRRKANTVFHATAGRFATPD